MLDRSKCKKMLVNIGDGEKGERIVLEIYESGSAEFISLSSENDFINGVELRDLDIQYSFTTEPIPEKKPMTNLDVMYWAGIRKVTKVNDDGIVKTSGIIMPAITFYTDDIIDDHVFNELVLNDDGLAVLKYDEWKEFNWENCK